MHNDVQIYVDVENIHYLILKCFSYMFILINFPYSLHQELRCLLIQNVDREENLSTFQSFDDTWAFRYLLHVKALSTSPYVTILTLDQNYSDLSNVIDGGLNDVFFLDRYQSCVKVNYLVDMQGRTVL